MTIAVYLDRRPVVVEPPRPVFTGFRSSFTSEAGVEFDLTDHSGGVVLLDGPVLGLHLPAETRHTSSSPGRAGSRYRGKQVLEREVGWVVGVYSDAEDPAEWVRRDRAFWQELEGVGVWTVESPDGTRRHLRVRLTSDGAHVFSRDPSLEGWAVYEVDLVAEDPYWFGDQLDAVRFEIGDGGAGDFIPPGGGPPFNVGQASTTSTATITNPGDVTAWLRWTIRATSATQAEVGVGASTIGLRTALNPGQVAVIDTERQSLVVDGVRVRGGMYPHAFAPVPPRSTVELNIEAIGAGLVEVELVPRYRRAW